MTHWDVWNTGSLTVSYSVVVGWGFCMRYQVCGYRNTHLLRDEGPESKNTCTVSKVQRSILRPTLCCITRCLLTMPSPADSPSLLGSGAVSWRGGRTEVTSWVFFFTFYTRLFSPWNITEVSVPILYILKINFSSMPIANEMHPPLVQNLKIFQCT